MDRADAITRLDGELATVEVLHAKLASTMPVDARGWLVRWLRLPALELSQTRPLQTRSEARSGGAGTTFMPLQRP